MISCFRLSQSPKGEIHRHGKPFFFVAALKIKLLPRKRYFPVSPRGFSKMTVSKCFHDSEDIPEETKQAVFKKADEMGYEYRKRVKYRIAVLFSEVYFEPNEKFYNELYKRLTEQEWRSSMKFPDFPPEAPYSSPYTCR